MMTSSEVELEKENDFRIENYAQQIDLKHNQYLEDMDQLQNTKFKIIELKGTLDSLQLEMSFQEDNLAGWSKSYQKEVRGLEEMMEQLRIRLANEKNEKVKMEEERCQRHLEHVEKLTNEKEELLGRIEEVLQRRKQLDTTLKKLKENFEQDYKKQREVWAKA
jgi:DNA repair exonuclease SbcCD ATPase subunit